MDIIALVTSILALVLSIIQFFVDSSHEKKEATLEAYNELQNDVFSNMQQPNFSVSDIKAGSEEWTEITAYLARLERFSVGINTGIYSIKILNRLGGGYYISVYEMLEPIIQLKRNANNVPGKHYNEFEKTVKNLRRIRKIFK